MATGCAACNPPMPPPVTCRPSRACTDHLEAKTTATMKLSALLEAHWPGAKAIFARLDSDIALDFLERYRTPQAAQRLGEARLAGFLGRHGYSGRRTPAQLLHRLRAAPVAVDQLDPEVQGRLPSASRSGCCAACLAASPTWIGP